MAKKIYCVKVGKVPGMYDTWDECKKQVQGFSGAVYKSFTNLNDANTYMDINLGNNPATNNSNEEILCSKDKAIAYVDGSYKHQTREFSCGAVLFFDGEELHFSEKYDEPSLSEMRNVAGEIMGAMTVINYCFEENIKEIDIYYDYEGIAKWALGLWKANKDGTKAYREFCIEKMKHIKINFVKVKGHSGDKYNDLADKLAKSALGIS